jgi:DNA-binding NarL/FixJ family response regulator
MDNAEKPIRVLLADDHPIVMAGFAMSLQGQGIEVVGQAKTPDEVLTQFDALQPDVAILDIRFGEHMSGFDVARRLLERHPTARIIFLSQFDQDGFIKEAYSLGGRAFVTKDCEAEELANAVRKVQRGELAFIPVIAERLANLSVQKDSSPQSLLDKRALTIFTLIAEGLTNAEIAEQLDISIKTVSNVSQVIKEKLGVSRQAEITRMAIKFGLIET